jgi:hypothetical protein
MEQQWRSVNGMIAFVDSDIAVGLMNAGERFHRQTVTSDDGVEMMESPAEIRLKQFDGYESGK